MRVPAKSGSPWQYTKPWIYWRAQLQGLGYRSRLALEEVQGLEPQNCGQASWMVGGQGCWDASVGVREGRDGGGQGAWWACMCVYGENC